MEFQDVQGHSPAIAGLLVGIVSVFLRRRRASSQGGLAGRYGTRAPILGGLAVLAASAVGLAELPASAPLFMQGPLLGLTGLGASPGRALDECRDPGQRAPVAGGHRRRGAQYEPSGRHGPGIAVFASSFHGRPAAEAVRLSLGCAALLYLWRARPCSRAPAPASEKTCDVIPIADH